VQWLDDDRFATAGRAKDLDDPGAPYDLLVCSVGARECTVYVEDIGTPTEPLVFPTG
jgi:hypothetical protein